MYNYQVHQKFNLILQKSKLDLLVKDNLFYTRLIANALAIHDLYFELYAQHPQAQAGFEKLIQTIIQAYQNRSEALQTKDLVKAEKDHWFLSNELVGMSLYVDRFCGNLKKLPTKFAYLKKLGVNFLHLMPIFQSPANESDGGYAVSDFRQVDTRFGTLQDLKKLRQKMDEEAMYLMLDIVLNHTSNQHEWALRAKNGEKEYQDYFYMYEDRTIPEQFEKTMPEIFPEVAPGNFTFVPEIHQWVMTVFHQYQWDLNYTNPKVLVAMLDNIFFYANLDLDVLRIDAPAFIWKEIGTTCQNLPKAHTLLRLIKQCVTVATPGMALLGEAIVAPQEVMKYFGTDAYTAEECDFAYNATHMALQWDALATGDVRVMLSAQPLLLQKPLGTSWITYTRCHDDIGLGYEDAMISQAGFTPYAHRKFIKDYYSGTYEGSLATGALFSVNPKTQDARLSGTLASLCGLEKALELEDEKAIEIALRKILLMQAHSFFLGGIPMLFYGDEVAYTNDYSYLEDEGKYYDNRWMHRPLIDWKKNQKIEKEGTIEQKIFSATQKLLTIRKTIPAISDLKNLSWLDTKNRHIALYIRYLDSQEFYAIFNFSGEDIQISWSVLTTTEQNFYEHWQGKTYYVNEDSDDLSLEAYSFILLETKD